MAAAVRSLTVTRIAVIVMGFSWADLAAAFLLGSASTALAIEWSRLRSVRRTHSKAWQRSEARQVYKRALFTNIFRRKI